MDGIDWPKKSLLYADDSQIQALSVMCRHGEDRPNIRIEARPFRAMLDDLELAGEVLQATESIDTYYERDHEDKWIETFRDLIRDEARQRQVLGGKLYEAYRKMARWSAQRALLGHSGVNIPVLGWMYGLPRGIPSGFDNGMWTNLVGTSKLRLQVGELPISTGGSSAFKKKVDDEITAFKGRWDWIIKPLVVAVALEVVVRPKPPSTACIRSPHLAKIVTAASAPGRIRTARSLSKILGNGQAFSLLPCDRFPVIGQAVPCYLGRSGAFQTWLMACKSEAFRTPLAAGRACRQNLPCIFPS